MLPQKFSFRVCVIWEYFCQQEDTILRNREGKAHNWLISHRIAREFSLQGASFSRNFSRKCANANFSFEPSTWAWAVFCQQEDTHNAAYQRRKSTQLAYFAQISSWIFVQGNIIFAKFFAQSAKMVILVSSQVPEPEPESILSTRGHSAA